MFVATSDLTARQSCIRFSSFASRPCAGNAETGTSVPGSSVQMPFAGHPRAGAVNSLRGSE
eukprot:122299-Pyramimonas_sp.AAC.1